MDETFTSKCPNCGAGQRIRAEWLGRKGRCKKCDFVFQLEPSVNEGSKGTRSTALRKPSSDDDDWMNDEGVSPQDAFRAKVRQALADGVITPSEREELNSLRTSYGLSNEIAKRIFDEEKANAVVTQPHTISSVDTSKVAKLLQIAEKASDAGNHEESLSFCNKALEEDPQNYHAWFGKAKSAGWLSTLSNFRLPEMLTGFQHAADFAPKVEKANVAYSGAKIVAEVTSIWFDSAHNHLLEYVQVDDAWREFLTRAAQALEGLKFAVSVLNDSETAEKAVQICCVCIRGVSYRDYDGSSARHLISEQYAATLRGEMDGFAKIIKRHRPSYALPDVKPVDWTCFVVTAVTGHPDHPTAVLLRRFRDEWLINRKWGKQLIRAYWYCGPPAARLIARSGLLKSVALFTIVTPAATVAKLILPNQNE